MSHSIAIDNEANDENTQDFKPFDVSAYRVDFEDEHIISRDADIKTYCKSIGIVSGKIVLQGEKTGDLIQIDTAFDGTITGIITSLIIHPGYTNIADVEVLAWSGQNS